ncbi:DOUBLE B-BOX 3, light-regulated zinc finger protein 1, B-box domain protein 22 [Hibiscus trionum]|uniref:DOUBLE B-BOX 3, light-regulated zinc finger protein 1, B-box domain protein 22 n=1 Tax=Hibiscus trionum TaxID=183268 RepID=A0A9W7GW16_HIBTR|nr:DOUBLE B-BOX 3, light-regulated zinc finger protein 1, B-box domain protein 22 [Hibiscus trionum]
MRIQCNVCEVAEAKVLCCSDEAALCLECDEKVHAANKLASKHQRVPLSSSSSSHMPKCDICQETSGFFFCLQDRALLCRKCDIAIHTANPYVSGHQRFVLTGVKVGLETTADPVGSSPIVKSPCNGKTTEIKSNSTSKSGAPMAFTSKYDEVLPSTAGADNSVPTKVSYGGGSTAGIIQPWQMDDLLGLTDFNQSFGYMDNEFSEADSGKRGDSDSSPILRSAEEDVFDDECMGQVPDSYWAVPQMPSPPTASGLHWPKDSHNQSDRIVFVPDISWSSVKSPFHLSHSGSNPKGRRRV